MLSKDRILIVEDERKIARLIQLELEHEGYETGMAYTGTEGLAEFQEHDWDLLLLDVMLPELSGLEVLRRIRANDDQTPVILLTARDALPDKVSGLDLGANDYITKPFQIEELLHVSASGFAILHQHLLLKRSRYSAARNFSCE